MAESKELSPQSSALSPEAVLPVLSADQMGSAIEAYRRMQAILDKSMPDQIIDIKGKKFRRKGYWRAIRTAFGLSVECVIEHRIQHDNVWGYTVTYRATAANGRFADGDGTCMNTEKPAMQATEHNIRSHAHTRAFNRAVSNLVGFGEVSAEEMQRAPIKPQYNTQDKMPTVKQNLRMAILAHVGGNKAEAVRLLRHLTDDKFDTVEPMTITDCVFAQKRFDVEIAQADQLDDIPEFTDDAHEE